MASIQYTIRNIPKSVDDRLRKQAKKQSKSFNQTVIDALERAAGVDNKQVVSHDLDWFIDCGSEPMDSTAFAEAQEWLHDLPKDLK